MVSKKKTTDKLPVDEVTSDSELENAPNRECKNQNYHLAVHGDPQSYDEKLMKNPIVAEPNYSMLTTESASSVYHLRRMDDVPIRDLNACYGLVLKTSEADYRASNKDWDPMKKMEEMMDPKTWYIILKRNELTPTSTEALAARAQSPPATTASVTSGSKAAIRDETLVQPPQASGLVQRTTLSDPILGFLSFKFEPDDWPNDDKVVLYIYELHLYKEHRGLGIGKQLLRMAEHICRQVGLGKVMLTVFITNPGANAFYRREGYYIDEDCSPRSKYTRAGRIVPDYRIRSKYLSEVKTTYEEWEDEDDEWYYTKRRTS